MKSRNTIFMFLASVPCNFCSSKRKKIKIRLSPLSCQAARSGTTFNVVVFTREVAFTLVCFVDVFSLVLLTRGKEKKAIMEEREEEREEEKEEERGKEKVEERENVESLPMSISRSAIPAAWTHLPRPLYGSSRRCS